MLSTTNQIRKFETNTTQKSDTHDKELERLKRQT